MRRRVLEGASRATTAAGWAGGATPGRSSVLAASERGAEVAVASGRTVRTFRDEDGFERLLGAFDVPAPAATTDHRVTPGEGADRDRRSAPSPPADPAALAVTRVAWAADGTLLAVVTMGGDVHVVSRVGRLVASHPARARPRHARGTPVAVALARRGENGWDLLVVVGSNPGGSAGPGPVHVTGLGDGEGEQTPGAPGAGRSMTLPGAPFRTPQGAAWNERRRILAVAGGACTWRERGVQATDTQRQSTGCSVGLWRYGGGGADETLVPVALVSAPGNAPDIDGGGGASVGGGVLRFFASCLGVLSPPPDCHVALRCDEGSDGVDACAAEVAVVDPARALRVWRAPTVSPPGTDPSEGGPGVPCLEPVSVSSDPSVASSFPVTDVLSAAWWSPGVLAVSRGCGAVVVASVPGLVNLLGDAPETFEGGAALVTCPRRAGEGGTEGCLTDGPGAATRARVVVLESPPPERGGSTRWRLATIGARSPAEMLQAHIDAEEWGVALQLARRHALDPDEVHKARWLASPPSKEAIADSLSKVSDRAWVAAQCAAAVACTYEHQRVVLMHGLKVTEHHIPRPSRPSPPVETNDASGLDGWDGSSSSDETEHGQQGGQEPGTREEPWTWWVRLRLTLLAHLDRLDTLHAVHLGNFAPAAYAAFREADLGDAAVALAAAGNPRAAEQLLRRHPLSAAPRLLDVLDAMPDTMPPSQYAALLPWTAPWCDARPPPPSTRGSRAADWAESAAAAARLREEAEIGGGDAEVLALAVSSGVSSAAAAVKGAAPPAAWLAGATEELVRVGGGSTGRSTAKGSADREDADGGGGAWWWSAATKAEGGGAGWAMRRARQMDAAAGAVGAAAELLAAAAAALGRPNRKEASEEEEEEEETVLEAAAAAAAELAAAVYGAALPDPDQVDASRAPATSKSLWSAPLADYVAAPPADRLAVVLSDAARSTDPATVVGALRSTATAAVLARAGGGAALRAWLIAVTTAGHVDVAAAAMEWIGGGSINHPGGEDEDSVGHASNDDERVDILGGATGLAEAAVEVTLACPALAPGAASRLAQMLESLPPDAAKHPRVGDALAAAVACRILSARGVGAPAGDVTPAAVAAAASAATSAAADQLTGRLLAAAVREARRPGSSTNRGSSSSSLAWSRALWSDLSALASPSGALRRHFSREDAAAALLRAQLRVGGGAERDVLARRVLRRLFDSTGPGAGDGDASDGESSGDVSVGAAVEAVAGAAAGELVAAAGSVVGSVAGQLRGAGGVAVGALGGVVKDVTAGHLPRSAGGAAVGALGALGGLVGGLGAAAAELKALGRVGGVAGAPAGIDGGGGGGGLPPSLPPRRAEAVVVETAREHLYAAASMDDPAIDLAEAVLDCAPITGDDVHRASERTTPSSGDVDGKTGGEEGAADVEENTVGAVRDVIAALRQLPDFGVTLAPARLRPSAADRTALIDACLTADQTAYRRVDELRQLAARLGLRTAAQQRHVATQCARHALAAGDVAVAAAAALRLAAADHAPAWALAADVAAAAAAADSIPGGIEPTTDRPSRETKGATVSSETRARLLTFALARGPPHRIPGLLAAWQALEAAKMAASAGAPTRTSPEDVSPSVRAGASALDAIHTADLRRAASPGRGEGVGWGTRPRPRLRALAAGTLPELLRKCAVSGGDEAARAAQALAYSLGLQGVAASDEVMAPLAVRAALAATSADRAMSADRAASAAAASADDAEAAAEVAAAGGALPPWGGLPLGFLVGLDSPGAVSGVIHAKADATCAAKERDDPDGLVGRRTALALGARVYALRAVGRVAGSIPGGSGAGVAARKAAAAMDPVALAAAARKATGQDAEAEAEGLRRCADLLRATADADWLGANLPGLADPAAFVADEGGKTTGVDEKGEELAPPGIRTRAILALAGAVGSPSAGGSLSASAALSHALRLGHAHGVCPAMVSAAHAAALLTAGPRGAADLAGQRPRLERAFTDSPAIAAAALRARAWPALPRDGRSGAGEAFAAYYGMLRGCHVAMGTNTGGGVEAKQNSAAAARLVAASAAASALATAAPALALRRVLGPDGGAPEARLTEDDENKSETTDQSAGTTTRARTGSVSTTPLGALAAALEAAAVDASGRLTYPAATVEAVAEGVRRLPAPPEGLTPGSVVVAAVVAVLSGAHRTGAPGGVRFSPEQRWKAAAAALPSLAPSSLVAVLRWAALGVPVHPLDRRGSARPIDRADGFPAEASLPLRVTALAAGVGQMEAWAGTRREPGEEDATDTTQSAGLHLPGLKAAYARLALVAEVRAAAPATSPAALRALEDAIAAAWTDNDDNLIRSLHVPFSLQAVAEGWAALGEPLRHVAALGEASRRVEGHTGGDVDHAAAVAAVLARALDRLEREVAAPVHDEGGPDGTETASAPPSYGGDERRAAAAALRRVVVGTLGDAQVSGGDRTGGGGMNEPGNLAAAGEGAGSYVASLARARGATFAALSAFASRQSVGEEDAGPASARGARAASLELLGEVAGQAGGEGAWRGWTPEGPDAGGTAGRLLAMRTAAAAAPLGRLTGVNGATWLEGAEVMVEDANGAAACFERLLVAVPPGAWEAEADASKAVTTLAAVLGLWERQAAWGAPPANRDGRRGPPRPMHAQWCALLRRGLEAGPHAHPAVLEVLVAHEPGRTDEDEEEEEAEEAAEEEAAGGEGWDLDDDLDLDLDGAGESTSRQKEAASRCAGLVTEEEARALVAAAAAGGGGRAAAKVSLLLPYRALRARALDGLLAAATVGGGGTHRTTDGRGSIHKPGTGGGLEGGGVAVDAELAALILRAGLLPKLHADAVAPQGEAEREAAAAVYRATCAALAAGPEATTCTLPYATASLAAARRYGAAAALALTAARVHPALLTLDAGVAVLERYLRGHAKATEREREPTPPGGTRTLGTVHEGVMASIRSDVQGRCADGLRALLADVRRGP